MAIKKKLTLSQINKPVTHLELAMELTRLEEKLIGNMNQAKSDITSHIDAFIKLHSKIDQEQTIDSHRIKNHEDRIQKLEGNYQTI